MTEELFDTMARNVHSSAAVRGPSRPPASLPPESTRESGEGPIFATRLRAEGKDLFVLSLPSPAARLPNVLTVAERHVAGLVLDGLSNRTIAQVRGTSVRTVANQIASVFRKLNVTGRAELGDAVVGRKRG
jgi:DNA-binding NarL/FixJ family response regulator